MLITIVSEGYALADAQKNELWRRQRAGIIHDLEATYLLPFARRATRRGKPCRLLPFPSCLLRLAHFTSGGALVRDARGVPGGGWVQLGNSKTLDTGLLLPTRGGSGFFSELQPKPQWASTERSLLRKIGEKTQGQISALEVKLEALTAKVEAALEALPAATAPSAAAQATLGEEWLGPSA